MARPEQVKMFEGMPMEIEDSINAWLQLLEDEEKKPEILSFDMTAINKTTVNNTSLAVLVRYTTK